MKTGRIRQIFSILAALLIFMLPLSSLSVPAEETSAYPDSWEAYMEENGIEEFTYNAVVDGMSLVLDTAAKTYESGDADTALKQISDAKTVYWGGSGFKVEMQKKLPAKRRLKVNPVKQAQT